MTRRITLGLLFSQSGSYALISRTARAGALKAVAEVNADPDLDLTFEVLEGDPEGDVDAYAPLSKDLLARGARHIVGCTTSWSRKEVIPVLEREGGVLWYPAPYEGFEASDRVVYTHASPNHHLVPLLDHAFSQIGRSLYLTGSNYIWGWEMNRLARALGQDAGADVLGERYLPLGATEVAHIVDEIAALKPDFVLNQLIGQTQYAFLAGMAELRARDPYFAAGRCPVLSCNLTECELPALEQGAEGLISAGPWFHGMPGALPGNFGRSDFSSSIEAAGHASVMMLARLLAERPGAEDLPLSALFADPRAQRMGISARTHHVRLPVAIAQVQDGVFTPIRTYPASDGDPYLTAERAPQAPSLRAVK